MNIFIVVNSLAGGGAERVALTLTREFYRQGFRVTLVLLQEIVHHALEDLTPNVDVVYLSGRSLVGGGIRLAELISRRRPTHVLCMMREPSIFLSLGRLRKKERWVFREASPLNALLRKPLWKQLLYKAILRLAYLRADLIIANSKGTASSINGLLNVEKKLLVIYNPIPMPSSRRDTEGNSLSSQGEQVRGEKYFLSVGRLDEVKGFDLLLDAFSELIREVNGCKLVIIGQGPLESELKSQISQLGIGEHVELVHWVADLSSYYLNSDFYVSASRYEGFGNTIVEAMSFGCFPLVSACPGGSKEIIISDDHGYVFEAESVEKLTMALKEVCEMTFDVNKVIERARDFDVQKIGVLYTEAILDRDYYQCTS